MSAAYRLRNGLFHIVKRKRLARGSATKQSASASAELNTCKTATYRNKEIQPETVNKIRTWLQHITNLNHFRKNVVSIYIIRIFVVIQNNSLKQKKFTNQKIKYMPR
jgi:hypothetical protein